MQKVSATVNENWFGKRDLACDWLRILAFTLLILYHVGMLYAENWGWHYKSSYSSKFLENIMLWSNQWRMSLLFIVSGVAVAYMLQKQKLWYFMRTRVLRIGSPLLFGMLVIVVPQVFVEARSQHIGDEYNYWQFWWAYLDQNSELFAEHKTIGQMHLTWNHLWFLPYILAYSLLACLLLPLGKAIGKAVVMPKLCRNFLSKRPLSEKGALVFSVFVYLSVLGLPIVLLYINSVFLWEKFPSTHNFIWDWFNHGQYLIAFLFGFIVIRFPVLWATLAGKRWILLSCALLTYSYVVFAYNGGNLGNFALAEEVNRLLWASNQWLWLLSIIAWVQHFTTQFSSFFNPRASQFFNRRIFCFYILHQTIIIVLAYVFVPMQFNVFTESVSIIVLTAIVCFLGYEIALRIPVLRSVMGVSVNTSDKPGAILPRLLARV